MWCRSHTVDPDEGRRCPAAARLPAGGERGQRVRRRAADAGPPDPAPLRAPAPARSRWVLPAALPDLRRVGRGDEPAAAQRGAMIVAHGRAWGGAALLLRRTARNGGRHRRRRIAHPSPKRAASFAPASRLPRRPGTGRAARRSWSTPSYSAASRRCASRRPCSWVHMRGRPALMIGVAAGELRGRGLQRGTARDRRPWLQLALGTGPASLPRLGTNGSTAKPAACFGRFTGWARARWSG